VNIDSLDVARIIKIYSESDTLVLKMDIEGAEYDLLQDFFKKNVSKLIDHIAIEYHSDLSPFKKPEDVIEFFLKLSGVKLLAWNRR
jgi:hypothetical protein